MADVLSRKSSGSLTTFHQLKKTLQEEFSILGIDLLTGRLSAMALESTLLEGLSKTIKKILS